jgi:hypothetical protein
MLDAEHQVVSRTGTEASMIKLYKRMEDGRLAYHEAWANGGSITEHWGIAGTRGERRSHRMKSRDEESEVERALMGAREAGYEEVDPDDERRLIVEYVISGMGTPADLEKRHRLEQCLNETLGWTGLGMCDGGSIGSGTMEVCCFVVDFDRSRAVVEETLKTTEFADYSRIYDEDGDAG